MATNRARKLSGPNLVEQIERDLGAIRRALRIPLESEIARGKLTPPQMSIIQMVVSHEGTSLKELSRAVGLAHSTVSGIVDRLESKGLLERRVDPADSRITRIHSSAVVKKFVTERLPKLTQSPLERARERASRTEQARISEAIRRLRELLDEIGVGPRSEASQP